MPRIPHVRVSSAPAGKVSSTDCLSPSWFSDPGTSPSSEVAVPWITDVNEVDAACEAFAALIVNRTHSGSVFAKPKANEAERDESDDVDVAHLGSQVVPGTLRLEI